MQIQTDLSTALPPDSTRSPATQDSATATPGTTASSSTGTGNSPSAPAAASAGASASDSSQSSSSAAIAQLKALIDRLQKQLAALQVQIAEASRASSPADAGLAATRVTTLQGQAATIEAGLQTAISSLAQLLMQSGSQTGLVNTQA